MRRMVVVGVVVAWSLACSGITDSLEQKAKDKALSEGLSAATGTQVDVEGGQVSGFSGADGSVGLGSSAKLPADWPTDVPTPKNGTIEASISSPSGTTPGTNDDTCSWTTAEKVPDLADQYRTALSGWQKSAEMSDSSGTTMMFSSPDGKRAVMFTATGDGTTSTVSVAVTHTAP